MGPRQWAHFTKPRRRCQTRLSVFSLWTHILSIVLKSRVHNIRDGVMEFMIEEITLTLDPDTTGNTYHAALVAVAPIPVNVLR